MKKTDSRGPIDLAKLRELTTEIIHSLGFVIDWCECAVANNRLTWPRQVAEDLGNATDMAVEVREQATRLELLVYTQAVAAKKLADKVKPRTCRKCGCTHTTPCVDQRTGATCHWVAKDLCSACAGNSKPKPQNSKRARRTGGAS